MPAHMVSLPVKLKSFPNIPTREERASFSRKEMAMRVAKKERTSIEAMVPPTTGRRNFSHA